MIATGDRTRCAAAHLGPSLVAAILVAAIATGLVAPVPARADQLTVESELDRSQVLVGEPAMLSITVTADGLAIPSLTPPTIPGLEVTPLGDSQGFSWINGRISRSVTSAYRIRASAPGDYEIPPYTVRSGKREARSKPIVLHVRATMPRSGGGPAGEEGPELFARLMLDRTRVYWNEGVTARFTLYSRVRIEGAPAWDPPDAPGFWTEVLGPARTGRIRVGGVEYDVTELRVAYFPTRTGKLRIGPGRVHAQVVRRIPAPDPWSTLGMPETQVQDIELTTEQTLVEVVPLPPGAPAAFHGAVGSYGLGVTVDRSIVRAREPVNVATVLRGEGNLAAASDPEVTSTLASRRYEAAATTRLDRSGLRLRGERRRETSFVPERSGSFDILPVRFAWFDPEQGRYRTQVSDTIRIRVLPAGAGSDSLGSSMVGPVAPPRTKRGAEGSLALVPPVTAELVAWGSLLAYLGTMAAFRLRDRARSDPAWRRRSELEAIGRELARPGGPGAPSPARAAVILRRAAEMRYAADVEGLPLAEAAERLTRAGMPAGEAAEWKGILDRLERLAYAPPDASGSEAAAEIAAAASLARRFRESLA